MLGSLWILGSLWSSRQMAVELNFEDIKNLANNAGAISGGKVVGSLGEVGSGQDLFQSINGLLDRVNNIMNSFKEMAELIRGVMPGTGLAQVPGRGQPLQPYQPQLTLPQQLHRFLNMAYTSAGDITITELIQGLLQQYGNTKLSAALKALERLSG
jgi:hypothetical protein